MLRFMGSQRVGYDWMTDLNWNPITSASFVPSNVPKGPVDYTLQDVWLYVSDHTIMVIWVIKIFLYSSSTCSSSCHLFLISSASIRFMQFPSFIEPIFAWNGPLVYLIILRRSLVFPILLFASISLPCSLRKAFLSLFAILWNSACRWVFLFLLCLSLLIFS